MTADHPSAPHGDAAGAALSRRVDPARRAEHRRPAGEGDRGLAGVRPGAGRRACANLPVGAHARSDPGPDRLRHRRRRLLDQCGRGAERQLLAARAVGNADPAARATGWTAPRSARHGRARLVAARCGRRLRRARSGCGCAGRARPGWPRCSPGPCGTSTARRTRPSSSTWCTTPRASRCRWSRSAPPAAGRPGPPTSRRPATRRWPRRPPRRRARTTCRPGRSGSAPWSPRC